MESSHILKKWGLSVDKLFYLLYNVAIISNTINILGAIEKGAPEEIKNDIEIYKNYYLRKWSNKNSRSRVGVICTIGPSVYDPQKGINRISELIKDGMNIARLNLSHFKLDEKGEPIDLDKMVDIIKTIRKYSDSLRIPVNIMLDLKGPEIRVAFFAVPNIKKLVPATSLEINEKSKFKIVSCEYKGPIMVKEPVLVLEIGKNDIKKKFIDIKENTYHFSIKNKPRIAFECEIENEANEKKDKEKDNTFDFRITRVEVSPGKDSFEVHDEIEISKVEKNNSQNQEEKNEQTKILAKINGIYEPALKIKKGDKLFITTDKEWHDNNDNSVIYLHYDGSFGKAIAAQHLSDPIYLDDGRASFILSSNKYPNHPMIEVIDGDKVELRKSMNLFNNACDSAEFISKIDEAYLRSILTREEFKLSCPIDSIAASFVRESCDLDRIDTLLQEYGVKDKKKWDIKLVAKIESPHCFMKRYIYNNERFNQEEIDFAEYKKILKNKLCWAVMVARGDLGVEIRPEKVPQIQKAITDLANIEGKGVIVATQMLLSMVHNKRPSRADVTDIHNAVLGGADVVMLSEETAKGDYPIDALKCMRSIINEAVKELMEQKNREIYLKKFSENKESEITNNIMELLGEPMVNISLKSGSPVIFSYALTGGTVTKIPRYRPEKPIIAITDSEMAARNMLFYFGVHPLLFVGTKGKSENNKKNSNQDKAAFDFPRDVKEYRKFLKAIIYAAIVEKDGFYFEKLKDITDGQIVFGLLGIDDKSSYLSDRAIVIFRYHDTDFGREQCCSPEENDL